MSIASEITRLQTSKADSKAQINIDKDIINDGIDFINNEKVDSYDEKIAEMQEAYKAFIPVNTTSDTQIDAPKGGTIIGKTIKGNTTQDGTPTPDAPVEVKNVTGLQTVTISNGTDSEDYEINLGNIELNKIGNYQDFIRKGSGKNLFDEQTEVGGYNPTTGEPQTNGAYRRNVNAIRVEPNTKYIFTRDGSTFDCRYFYYDINHNFLNTIVVNGSITTPNNCYYMNFHSDQLLSNYANLQIEQGTTVTYYEPYGYKDKWYIEKNVGKYQATGNESLNSWYNISNDNIGFYFYYNKILNGNIENAINGRAFCNSFSEVTSRVSIANGNVEQFKICGTDASYIAFGLNKNKLSDYSTKALAISSAKTWLQNNRVIIYYVLANPTYSLIENEELIEQLDKTMQLYEGQNNISITGDLAATFDLDYIVRADKHLIGNRREGK